MTENNDDPFDVPPHIALRAAAIPYAFARKHGVVMLAGDGERLEIAVREGSDPRVLLEVRRHLARSFDVRFVDPAQFDRHLSEHYAMDGSAAAMAGSLEVNADDMDLLATDLQPAEELLNRPAHAPPNRRTNGCMPE